MARARAQLEAAQARIDAALVAAEAANARAKAEELEDVVKLSAEVKTEATAMQAMFTDRIARLADLCSRGGDVAPASLLPENDALRARILAAAKIVDRKEAEKKLLAIEREIVGEKVSSDAPEDPHVTLVRYFLAENQREIASDLIRAQKRAEPALVESCRLYKAVLKCADTADESIGTSLHASALRRLVQVNASLRGGYLTFGRDPEATPNNRARAKAKSEEYAAEAVQAFRKLEAEHPNEMDAKGANFVQLARADAERLGQ